MQSYQWVVITIKNQRNFSKLMPSSHVLSRNTHAFGNHSRSRSMSEPLEYKGTPHEEIGKLTRNHKCYFTEKDCLLGLAIIENPNLHLISFTERFSGDSYKHEARASRFTERIGQVIWDLLMSTKSSWTRRPVCQAKMTTLMFNNT